MVSKKVLRGSSGRLVRQEVVAEVIPQRLCIKESNVLTKEEQIVTADGSYGMFIFSK